MASQSFAKTLVRLQAETQRRDDLKLLRAADVPKRPVEWFWPSRIVQWASSPPPASDPGRHLMVPVKNNLAPTACGLAYSIKPHQKFASSHPLAPKKPVAFGQLGWSIFGVSRHGSPKSRLQKVRFVHKIRLGRRGGKSAKFRWRRHAKFGRLGRGPAHDNGMRCNDRNGIAHLDPKTDLRRSRAMAALLRCRIAGRR